MSKRTIKTSHSAIFNYWKDKAITSDGEIILDSDMSKSGISVITDWTRPCCFACCDLM